MAEHVSFDYSLAKGVIGQDELTSMKAAVLAARDTLENKKGAGNDFLGWIDLPEDYDKEEFARIQKAAEKIQSDSEVPTWEPERLLNFCATVFTTVLIKK